MKQSVEIDFTSGPVPLSALRTAVLATSHVRDAEVLVTQRSAHLGAHQDSFTNPSFIVLRIEWET